MTVARHHWRGMMLALSCAAVQVAHAAGAPVEHSAATTAKPPPSTCTVSAAAAVAAGNAATLIDVRHAADKSPVWIPGAVRLAPSAVATFAAGVKGDLYWIGSGGDDATLLGECRALPAELRARVRVVDGGIRAWHRAKGKVFGSTPMLDRPLLLEPAQLDTVLRDAQPRVVEVGAARLAADVVASRRSRVDDKSAPEQAFAGPAAHNGDVRVFVVRDAGDVAKWWNAWQSTSAREPLFFVEPGERFAGYVRQRNAIAANANKALTPSCDHK